jgi:hypothetical protein
VTTGRERSRKARQRKRNGRAVVPVDVNLDRLVLALEEHNFLRSWDEDSPAAIKGALERMIDTFICDTLGPPA